MRAPTLHLNGSSPRLLTEALEAAVHALDEAIDKLRDTAPNGRDYYPQGPSAISEAEREHCARLDKLVNVHDELATLWETVVNAGPP